MVHILLKNPQLFSTVLARSAHTVRVFFEFCKKVSKGEKEGAGGEWRASEEVYLH